MPVIAIVGFGISGVLSSETGLEYLMPLGIILAAIALRFIGVSFEKKPGKIMIDPETNEHVEFKTRHTFFRIPIKWRGLILGLLAVPMMISLMLVATQSS